MSTESAEATATTVYEDEHAAHGTGHAHPTDKTFVMMAVWLAVITAIEVAWSYLPVWEDATGWTSFAEIAGLLAMMALKFVLIAGTFMHLKFDNKLLTRVFYTGVVLAFGVYIAALTTFEIWGS